MQLRGIVQADGPEKCTSIIGRIHHSAAYIALPSTSQLHGYARLCAAPTTAWTVAWTEGACDGAVSHRVILNRFLPAARLRLRRRAMPTAPGGRSCGRPALHPCTALASTTCRRYTCHCTRPPAHHVHSPRAQLYPRFRLQLHFQHTQPQHLHHGYGESGSTVTTGVDPLHWCIAAQGTLLAGHLQEYDA